MRCDPSRDILFVCLGNICRSPLAEGVFGDELARRGAGRDFAIDSAGIGGWHVGNPPDRRSVAVAARHHVDISRQRARQITPADFAMPRLILAMDRSNLADLKAMAPAASPARIALFLEESLGRNADVPDPYYGGSDGFETVYRLIREAAAALAARLTP